MDSNTRTLIDSIIELADTRARHAALLRARDPHADLPADKKPHVCEVEVADLEIRITRLRRKIAVLSEQVAAAATESQAVAAGR